MKINDLLLSYVNREQRPRKLHRYWATDVYKIIKGYLTAGNFFLQKPIDITGAKNIISGEAYESKWKEILEANKIEFQYGDKIKREIKIKQIVLVVKPDFEMNNWVLETKYPTKPTNEIPDKWVYQLECESRATKKKVYLGVFEYPFYIRYFEYKPSDKRWEDIQQTLINFDKKLTKIAEKS